MNVRQLIAAIRKPGPVQVCVMMEHDTCYIEAVKSDLIDYLQNYEPDAAAPWEISSQNGRRYLDY
jgi:hypothetical protein